MRYLEDLPLRGLQVFLRVDFNVPLSPQGAVLSDLRIRFSMPTIQYLINQGAKLIVASHLGRPKGKVVLSLSLKGVAERTAEMLGRPVLMAPDCIGPEVEKMAASLEAGQLLLLENLRFHPQEEANDRAFARSLASLAQVYVNDAFGSTHRAHASVVAITDFVQHAGAGFLLRKELERLEELITAPRKPFLVLLGGAKVSGKLQVIEHLLMKADCVAVGGGMAYTFLKCKGLPTGRSLVEEELLPVASKIMADASAKGVPFLLPVDHVTAPDAEAASFSMIITADRIPEGYMGLDVGPKTVELFRSQIRKAKTIFWNGPVGLFEQRPYAEGTSAIAREVATSGAVTVVGGGDTVAAMEELGLLEKVSHASTGGGATLDFLAGKPLPGIEALRRKR